MNDELRGEPTAHAIAEGINDAVQTGDDRALREWVQQLRDIERERKLWIDWVLNRLTSEATTAVARLIL